MVAMVVVVVGLVVEEGCESEIGASVYHLSFGETSNGVFLFCLPWFSFNIEMSRFFFFDICQEIG